MIDLHLHSTFSDGSLSPASLVERGREVGLTALALTDHDSTAGLALFAAACLDGGTERPDIVGIAGLEISVDVPVGTMHMLAYFFDPEDARLQKALADIREGRAKRNRQILQRLNELGFPLTWDDVAAQAGEDMVGRPHFAQALCVGGYVDSKKSAFDRYLGKGKAAYFERFRLAPRASLSLIRGAGGVPVLAHPCSLGTDAAHLKRYVAELKAWGLQGIETYHSEHGPALQRQYLALAGEFDLVATGGSDFHGDLNPDIKMGTGFGSLHVPDDVVEALRSRRA